MSSSKSTVVSPTLRRSNRESKPYKNQEDNYHISISVTKKRKRKQETDDCNSKINTKKLVPTTETNSQSSVDRLFSNGKYTKYGKDHIMQCFLDHRDITIKKLTNVMDITLDDFFMVVNKKDMVATSYMQDVEYVVERLCAHANITKQQLLELRGWRVNLDTRTDTYKVTYLQTKLFFLHTPSEKNKNSYKKKCNLIAGSFGLIIKELSHMITCVDQAHIKLNNNSVLMKLQRQSEKKQLIVCNEWITERLQIYQLEISATRFLFPRQTAANTIEEYKGNLFKTCMSKNKIFKLCIEIISLVWWKRIKSSNKKIAEDHLHVSPTKLQKASAQCQLHNYLDLFLDQNNIQQDDVELALQKRLKYAHDNEDYTLDTTIAIIGTKLIHTYNSSQPQTTKKKIAPTTTKYNMGENKSSVQKKKTTHSCEMDNICNTSGNNIISTRIKTTTPLLEASSPSPPSSLSFTPNKSDASSSAPSTSSSTTSSVPTLSSSSTTSLTAVSSSLSSAATSAPSLTTSLTAVSSSLSSAATLSSSSTTSLTAVSSSLSSAATSALPCSSNPVAQCNITNNNVLLDENKTFVLAPVSLLLRYNPVLVLSPIGRHGYHADHVIIELSRCDLYYAYNLKVVKHYMAYGQALTTYKGKNILLIERSRDYDDDMVGVLRYENNFTIRNLYDTATGLHLEPGNDEKMNWARHINYSRHGAKIDHGRDGIKQPASRHHYGVTSNYVKDNNGKHKLCENGESKHYLGSPDCSKRYLRCSLDGRTLIIDNLLSKRGRPLPYSNRTRLREYGNTFRKEMELEHERGEMITPFVNVVTPDTIHNHAVCSHTDNYNGSRPSYNITGCMSNFLVLEEDFNNPDATMFRNVVNVNSRGKVESEMEKNDITGIRYKKINEYMKNYNNSCDEFKQQIQCQNGELNPCRNLNFRNYLDIVLCDECNWGGNRTCLTNMMI